MIEFNNLSDPDKKAFANVPGTLLLRSLRIIYNFLSSKKLALTLLIVILTCCLTGVTVFRGAEAGAKIFSTLWFNSILVLLVVNVVFCFFPRMWGRKVTFVSLGMILFHLSFVAILVGIIYNSMFYFRGLIRLTESETLPSGDPASYDYEDHGRFFDFSRLKGNTTLIKMHRGYKVDDLDKQVAYEVAVGEGSNAKQGIIYITHKLEHNGFGYFREKEGYSLLIRMHDGLGRELYGAYISLQSLKQKGNQYLYTTGTKEGPRSLLFPQEPLQPVFAIQVAYHPAFLKERAGEVSFKVWSLAEDGPEHETKHLAEVRAAIGKMVKAGNYYLSVGEVRYWVGMNVRYEPGKPVVLASLWVGLSGIIITFIGRMTKGRRNGKAS